LFALISVASLMTTAYLYGKQASKVPIEKRSADVRTKLLIGRLVRIEPLHFYVESESLGPSRTYDVLISPSTQLLQLAPWAPGEKEAAVKEHEAYIERTRPKDGDPLPPPPLQMKPGPLDPKALVPGTMLGVLTDTAIDPDEPIVALAIRPLTTEEMKTGQVANTFPLQ